MPNPLRLSLLPLTVAAAFAASLATAATAEATLTPYGEGITQTAPGNLTFAVKPASNSNSWWWWLNNQTGNFESICYRYQINNGGWKAPNGDPWNAPINNSQGATGPATSPANSSTCPVAYGNTTGSVPATNAPKSVTASNGSIVEYCVREWIYFSNSWSPAAGEQCSKVVYDSGAPSAGVSLKLNGNDVTTTNQPENVVINISYNDAISPPRYRTSSGAWGENYVCTTTGAACNAGSNFVISEGCSQGTQTLSQTFQCEFGNPPSDGTYYACFKVFDGAIADGTPSNFGLNPNSPAQTYPAASGNSTVACDSITVDRAAPETSITGGPANGGTTSDNTPTFDFSGSGSPTSYECSVDSTSNYGSCTSPYTTGTLSNGSHTFRVRAKDGAGNVDSTPAARTFTVNSVAPDTTPPNTMIDSGPAQNARTNDATPTFGFSANETSTFQCAVDSGGFSSCTSTKTIGPLTDGSHTFYVRATDTSGNTDLSPASRSFTVDTTPPNTTIDSGPANGSTITDTTPQFGFSASESSDLQCSVDGGPFSPCSSPKVIGPLGDGSHTFRVYAIDAASNSDTTPATRSFTVDTSAPPDTTAPNTTIDSGPAAGSTTSDATPTFGFSSNEAGSSFACSIDGGSFAACSSPHTTATLANGSHTFSVRATDSSANTDASPATRTFTVQTTTPPPANTTPPQTEITAQPDKKTKSKSASFSFRANEPGTFQCSLDGAAFTACTSPFTKKVKPGRHTFAVKARDTAGNLDASPAAYSWKVKKKKKRR